MFLDGLLFLAQAAAFRLVTIPNRLGFAVFKMIFQNRAAALRCVTKLSEDEDYDHFIARVKTNPLAVKVKLNDLKDNMDITRLEEVTEKDLTRLNKYIRAYRQLKEES